MESSRVGYIAVDLTWGVMPADTQGDDQAHQVGPIGVIKRELDLTRGHSIQRQQNIRIGVPSPSLGGSEPASGRWSPEGASFVASCAARDFTCQAFLGGWARGGPRTGRPSGPRAGRSRRRSGSRRQGWRDSDRPAAYYAGRLYACNGWLLTQSATALLCWFVDVSIAHASACEVA